MENEEQLPGETTVEMRQSLQREHTSRFMEYLLDNENFLEKLERNLKGEAWDFKLKRFARKGKPKLNDAGTGWVMLQLQTFTDKLFQTSNFTSDEIERDIEDFEHDLIDHLSAHADEYELDVLADLKVIYILVSQTVYAERKKSQNAGFFKGIGQSTQHTEMVSDRPQQRGAGKFWSKFKEQMPI